jgi:16S rRNA (cytosine1402-N4)-methyltransferase
MLALDRTRPEVNVVRPDLVHVPVLLDEVLEILRPSGNGVFVDATVGGGGHTEALLRALGPEGRVVGIDRDPEALVAATRRLQEFGSRFVPIHGNHADLQDLLSRAGVFAIDGVLADLGISSRQLDDPDRGFSFLHDGPLDMRMDPGSGPSAAGLLASVPEPELRRILAEYGEERRAGAIARAIVRLRQREPMVRTRQLAELVERVAGPAARAYRIHPATRTFQAIRIAVNRELESIDRFVRGAVSLLRLGGRIAVISFHSLEDRVVKHSLRDLAHRCVCPPGLPRCGCGRENLARVLTQRPRVPGAAETAANPRARSARLRAAERT